MERYDIKEVESMNFDSLKTFTTAALEIAMFYGYTFTDNYISAHTSCKAVTVQESRLETIYSVTVNTKGPDMPMSYSPGRIEVRDENPVICLAKLDAECYLARYSESLKPQNP